MSYREFPQEPYPPPGVGFGGLAPPPPPPRGEYPSDVRMPPFGPPFDGFSPPPPPPPQHVRHQHYEGGYQGYFNEGYPPGPLPLPPQHVHHQHYNYQDYDSSCPSLLRGCLAALCCCCLLEECF